MHGTMSRGASPFNPGLLSWLILQNASCKLAVLIPLWQVRMFALVKSLDQDDNGLDYQHNFIKASMRTAGNERISNWIYSIPFQPSWRFNASSIWLSHTLTEQETQGEKEGGKGSGSQEARIQDFTTNLFGHRQLSGCTPIIPGGNNAKNEV
jgi:hypothetical protein